MFLGDSLGRPCKFNLNGNSRGQPVADPLLSYSVVPEESAKLQLQEDCPLIYCALASRGSQVFML